MAITCCEITWLLSLLRDVDMHGLEPITLFYANQVALYIAHNLIFHESTKHIKVDCH